MFWVINNPAFIGASATTRKLPIYSVNRDEKAVAISFDAAWGNEDTQQLIDTLDRYKVHATFFLVGQWVDKFPESVKALYDAGHEIGNHSATHPHCGKLSSEQIVREINDCNDKIEALTGTRPTLFRAPYGEYDDHVIAAAESAGVTVIQWDVDSLDWKDLTATEITKRVLSGVKPGSIVLFHNAAKHTPEALPSILESLIADGYKVVTVSELLLEGETYLDHTGKQFRKNAVAP
jgi:polysaccharide deacetylase family sporulation protein PdaB